MSETRKLAADVVGYGASPVPTRTGFWRGCGRSEAASTFQPSPLVMVTSSSAPALHLVGILLAQRGNHVESVRQIDLALKINPKAASAHEAFSNRGNALQELKRFDGARSG